MRRTGTALRRMVCWGLGCTLLALGGCDRGSAPEQLGRMAPALNLHDGQESVDLQQMRGHVVLLNFWASWCPPCLAEMPSLEALQAELPAVHVVGVAFDEQPDAYRAYMSSHPLPFVSVLDAQGTAHASFGTFRPPESYVIDKQGVIRRKYIGAQDWTSPEIVAMLRRLSQA